MELNLVYVRLDRDHFKSEAIYTCISAGEALRLAKWLHSLGHNVQRIDSDIYNAMSDKIYGRN